MNEAGGGGITSHAGAGPPNKSRYWKRLQSQSSEGKAQLSNQPAERAQVCHAIHMPTCHSCFHACIACRTIKSPHPRPLTSAPSSSSTLYIKVQRAQPVA